jgi:DNA topoisomerase-6 subunit B
MKSKVPNKLTDASIAEYFNKNIQMVVFPTPTKAVLTTIKECVDNSLDACEDMEILPELNIEIQKMGPAVTKPNSDLIRILVLDNGPGIDVDLIPRVFGTFLASSKFGRGRCSRGQQGIGSSGILAFAQQTTTQGVRVISKTSKMKKAYSCTIEIDIKNNKGIVKNAKEIDVDFNHGTSVEFFLDGRVQLNGDAGIMAYLNGTALVNPALTLHYKILDDEKVTIERVTTEVQRIPEAVDPHPHTMDFAEFNNHLGIYSGTKTRQWLKESFSRMADGNIQNLLKHGVDKKVLETKVEDLTSKDQVALYNALQKITLQPPSTKSVRQIGEANLEKSIQRLGNVDFFSVISRPATICEFKPLQVEVAVARLESKGGEQDSPVQVLRFANLVPLQFDKKSCVTVQAIESVNWRAYGLQQSKDSLPTGPYIFAISIVSPFIKFKNASKETIEDSDDLHQEIRLALIQAGQKIAKFVKHEAKQADLEKKLKYIEQFSPILLDCLFALTNEPKSRRPKLEKGLRKILGRDADKAEESLDKQAKVVEKHIQKQEEKHGKK